MKFSSAYIHTLREAPADAEVISHKLLARAGYIRKLGSGLYSYTPLMYRSLEKVKKIISKELDKRSAVQLLLPQLQPIDIWQSSGRYDNYTKTQKIMFTLKNHSDADFCLGPTHEEVITDLVSKDVKSYKQLPVNLYQIQSKFRDETRPRFGLLRCVEFIMKDGYSFHATTDSLDETYKLMDDAYTAIFSSCGLDFRKVEADSGAIGGTGSHEFMVLAHSGEDTLIFCDSCDYAANVEKAVSKPHKAKIKSEEKLEKVNTPDITSIDDLATFFKVDKSSIAKTVVYKTSTNDIVIALIRGDYEVNPVKLANYLKVDEVTILDNPEDHGLVSGFIGPIDAKYMLIIDKTLTDAKNLIIGANEKDYHYKGTAIGRDFSSRDIVDIRKVEAGDNCVKCGSSLSTAKGIEVGHIFKLGTKYSKAMKAHFTDEKGKENPYIMGCYGIGVSRLVAAAVEQSYDEDGIIMPPAIAPYFVHLIVADAKKANQKEAADNLYQQLLDANIEVLYDDRDERPGFKFKDADLIGIPYRIVVGKDIDNGSVEFVVRKGKVKELVSADEILAKIKSLVLS
jgi:prolyl-tRNA synthetase